MEVMMYLVFFIVGLVIGTFLAFVLEYGKDTVIARFTKTSKETVRK